MKGLLRAFDSLARRNPLAVVWFISLLWITFVIALTAGRP